MASDRIRPPSRRWAPPGALRWRKNPKPLVEAPGAGQNEGRPQRGVRMAIDGAKRDGGRRDPRHHDVSWDDLAFFPAQMLNDHSPRLPVVGSAEDLRGPVDPEVP